MKFSITDFKWSMLSNDGELDLVKLKKMQARRLTQTGKLAIDLSLQLIEDRNIDAVVQSSRHGEVNISYDLITAMHQEKSIPSPMKFSQSTHNSIGSQLTIFSKLKVPLTAISAGEESFSMGLLNAIVMVQEKKINNVLYLFTDSKIPDVYYEEEFGSNVETTCGVIISRGEQYQLKKTAPSDSDDRFEFELFQRWIDQKEETLSFSQYEIISC